MKFPVLDIPDRTADWPAWLEQQLVGLDLRQLVLDLQTVTEPQEQVPPPLDELLAGKLDEILTDGLAAQGETPTRQLLNHPVRLLDLQERILMEGGKYWEELPLSPEQQQRLESDWQQVSEKIDEDAPVSLPLSADHDAPENGRRAILRQLLALAAMIAIVAGYWSLRSPQQGPQIAGWGFEQQGLLEADLPSAEYLESLAAAGNTWFRKRPDSREDLQQRLEEFRHGCDTLISAPHPQLTGEDRDWLVERCSVWKGKIEGHLAALSAGERPITEIRDEADATVRQLVEALRQRARAA